MCSSGFSEIYSRSQYGHLKVFSIVFSMLLDCGGWGPVGQPDEGQTRTPSTFPPLLWQDYQTFYELVIYGA